MKRTRLFLPLAALCAVASGCGSDESADGVPSAGGASSRPVTVTARVGERSLRAGNSSEELPDSFRLSFWAEGGNSYEQALMRLGASGSSYEASAPLTWGTENRRAKVFAWTVPVDAKRAGYAMRGDMQTVSVAADQTSRDSIRLSDFVYARREAGSSSEEDILINGDALAITFSHAFSKLEVACRLGNELRSLYPDAVVSRVEIGQVYRGGRFNFESGSPWGIVNEYLKDKGVVRAYLNEPSSSGGDVLAEAVLVPQYFDLREDRATVTVTLSNHGVPWTMPAATVETSHLYEGTRYRMTLNIGRDVVNASEVSVEPWRDGGTYEVTTE